MTVIDWFRRRRQPTAKAVSDFSRVTCEQGLDLDYEQADRLAELLESDDSENFEEIAKLLGQSGNELKL
jgi:hypothetical protein